MVCFGTHILGKSVGCPLGTRSSLDQSIYLILNYPDNLALLLLSVFRSMNFLPFSSPNQKGKNLPSDDLTLSSLSQREQVISEEQFAMLQAIANSHSSEYNIYAESIQGGPFSPPKRKLVVRSKTPQEKLQESQGFAALEAQRIIDTAKAEATQIINQAKAQASETVSNAKIQEQTIINSAQVKLHEKQLSIEKERRESLWRMVTLFILGGFIGCGLLLYYLSTTARLQLRSTPAIERSE